MIVFVSRKFGNKMTIEFTNHYIEIMKNNR